jgi:hypothetical protein
MRCLANAAAAFAPTAAQFLASGNVALANHGVVFER